MKASSVGKQYLSKNEYFGTKFSSFCKNYSFYSVTVVKARSMYYLTSSFYDVILLMTYLITNTRIYKQVTQRASAAHLRDIIRIFGLIRRSRAAYLTGNGPSGSNLT